MKQDTRKHIKQLEAILQSVVDGKVCYKLASEKAHNENVRQVLTKYAEERNTITEDIATQITKMRGTIPDTDDDTGNVIDRALLNIKTTFGDNGADDRAALELCRSSDQKCLETFDQVLQGEILETELKPFLITQRYKVSKAFYDIDKLYFDRFKTSPEL